MHTLITAASVAQVVAPTSTGTGQAVVIAIPVLLLIAIAYLCRHRRHKISTAVLGFVTGALLGATPIGAAFTRAVVEVITRALSAIGGIFG
jgi:hypothetical protein